MGQYYKAVFLEPDKKTPKTFGIAHSVDCGIKMMEHAYIDNPLLNSVLNYMFKNKDTQDFHLVWAGDYADDEPGTKKNIYSMAGDEEDNIPEIPYETEKPDVRFIVNLDKMQYVDLWNIPRFTYMQAHPLALLTAEGNGRGGGDYEGTNMKYVGLWARDTITVMDSDWNNATKLHNEGYVELKPDFIESYELIRTFEDSCQAFTKSLKNGEINLCDSAADRLREQVKEFKSALPRKKYPKKK
jgi:hypothetical protein